MKKYTFKKGKNFFNKPNRWNTTVPTFTYCFLLTFEKRHQKLYLDYEDRITRNIINEWFNN